MIEVFLKDTKILSSSLCAGGRYDNMIGDFLGGGRKIPALGISFGMEPILQVMKLTSKIQEQKSVTTVFVIPIGTLKQSMKIAQEFRDEGIKTDIDMLGRAISKNLDYVNKLGIPFTIIFGKKELAAKKLTLRDMKTGKEKLVTVIQAIKILQ